MAVLLLLMTVCVLVPVSKSQPVFTTLNSESEHLQRRFHLITDPQKYGKDCQSYCRANYTDLATIENMEQMNLVKEMVKTNSPSSDVWIGLQKTSSKTWKWCLESPGVYQNWSGGSPGSSGDCGFIKGGLWTNGPCSDRNPFVCYNESTGPVFVNQQMSWTNAQNFCRNSHSDLTSVKDEIQNKQIQNLINSSTTSVWIGLFRDWWNWSDSSDSGFRYWATGEPDGGNDTNTQPCVQIYHTDAQLGWNDAGCDYSTPFVCHEDPLVLVQENLMWLEALTYCREHYKDLVSVQSPQDQWWVQKVSRNATTNHVWLGLRHSCPVGLWFWVNGLVPCYDSWAPGNGTGEEDCLPTVRSGAAESRGNHRWVSFPETVRLNFLCRRF